MSDVDTPGSGVEAELEADETEPSSDAEGGRAEAVLSYLATNLVDDPDAVTVTTEPARHGGAKLSLHVGDGDMGKVIGRRGRIAQSIRGVVRAAGATEQRDVVVDIVDD